MQPRPLGGLLPLCALAAVITAAAWPGAARAQLDSGRSPTGSRSGSAAPAPKLWAVEIDRYSTAFLRSSSLARIHEAGANAIVVDPMRLTVKQLQAAVRAARRAKLR